MTGWTETYRGVVKAWECDVFAHFTIAFYYDRMEDCSAAMLQALGAGKGWRTDSLVARYRQELRGGDGLHGESALLSAGAGELVLAHKFFNSVTGELTTEVEHHLVAEAGATPVAAPDAAVEWQPVGPTPAEAPRGEVATGRDLVKPGDVDADGLLTWSSFVHRFSGCGPHMLSRIGMTPAYMREHKQGFSTFETRLTLDGPRPRVGDLLAMRSGILKIGKSSIQVVHAMTDVRTGKPVARLHQAGVQLDMVARRSNPWPDAIRQAGEAVLAGR